MRRVHVGLCWCKHPGTQAMSLKEKFYTLIMLMIASCSSATANQETIKVFKNTLWRGEFGNKGGASLVNATDNATMSEVIASLTYCFRFNLQVLSGSEKEFFGILLNIGEW